MTDSERIERHILDINRYREICQKEKEGESLTDTEFIYKNVFMWGCKDSEIYNLTDNEQEYFVKSLISLHEKGAVKELCNDKRIRDKNSFFKEFLWTSTLMAVGNKFLKYKGDAFRQSVKTWINEYVDEIFPPCEQLPKLPKAPKRYIAPNNTLMDRMTSKQLINAGAVDITVSQEKGITSYVMVGDITGKPSDMSNFERETMNAVCSIWKQAEIDRQSVVIYTPASIYKAMPGGGTKSTKAMQDKIEKAFDKMMQTPLELDATKELRAYKKIGEGETYRLKTMLLHADKHEYTLKNGRKTVGWQLFTKPAIYDYAERTGQLINVDMKVTQIEKRAAIGDTWDPVSINELRRDVLSYLIRRVAVIKHAWDRAIDAAKLKRNENKHPNQLMKLPPVIAYDSVYAAVGANTQNRNQLRDIREFCGIVLKYWVRIGYIDGYKELSEGRRKKSLNILFN
jgi:hypothetical protein